MVGAAVLLAGGFLLSSVSQSAVAQSTIVGGYTTVPLTDEATSLLIAALRDEDNYAADVAERVCVRNVTALSEQVVAGINYRFEIEGSAVESADAAGWCADGDNSAVFSYEVTLFEQAWLDSVQVTAIELLGLDDDLSSSDSGSGSGSWGYTSYSSSSFDSSASDSSSSSDRGVSVGDVDYTSDKDASASTRGSVDNETISYAGL